MCVAGIIHTFGKDSSWLTSMNIAQKEKEGADGQLGRLNTEHRQVCASKEALQKAHDELQANAANLQAQVCARTPAV